MANSFQSPVAGEPSLGTPHPHVERLVNGPGAGTGTYTYTVTAPAGATQVYLWAEFSSGTAGTYIFVQSTAGVEGFRVFAPVANQYIAGAGIVRLDASKQFNVVVGGAALGAFYLETTLYWL
jgi:hypothetical protein